MSSYEIRINEIRGSTFAIGDNAKAGGGAGPADRGEMEKALAVLLGIVGGLPKPTAGEPDAGAGEVLRLADAARDEIETAEPDKAVFRRLVAATRKLMGLLGAKIVEAGALADAVAKIADLTRHL